MSGWDRFWYGVVKLLGLVQLLVIRHLVKDPAWRSFNGTVTSVRQMTDRHLYNVIKMLEGQALCGERLPAEYAAMVAEQRRRLRKVNLNVG